MPGGKKQRCPACAWRSFPLLETQGCTGWTYERYLGKSFLKKFLVLIGAAPALTILLNFERSWSSHGGGVSRHSWISGRLPKPPSLRSVGFGYWSFVICPWFFFWQLTSIGFQYKLVLSHWLESVVQTEDRWRRTDDYVNHLSYWLIIVFFQFVR